MRVPLKVVVAVSIGESLQSLLLDTPGFSLSRTVSYKGAGPDLQLSSPLQKDWNAAPFVSLFAFVSCAVQVSELSSEVDGKRQEVASLQRSLTAAQQEKDSLEQTLASLVRAQDFQMLFRPMCHCG